MAPVDNRHDRIYWAIANTAVATFVSLPLMWGLAKETSLKFVAGIGGTVVAVNAIRLLDLHEQGAPVRSAWSAAGQMVNCAWIEEMALAILPPRVQQQEFAGSGGGSDYYLSPPSPPQFQLAAPPPESENLPDRGDDRKTYGKMPGLSWYPSVLGYGIPGAGKTTFFEEEVNKRLALGHKVIVLDPHAGYGQWEGCEVIGSGMDYEAIDAKMVWFEKEIKRRYQLRQTQPDPKFQPLTILAEEFTNWAVRCKNSADHFKTVNSDIRKVECYSIIVTHTRTLAGLGDAKGMASLRDESMLEVEILGDYDLITERATPRFEALVKMPGQALSDRTLVKIERRSDKLHHQAPKPSPDIPRSYPEASSLKSENSGSPVRMPGVDFEAIYAQVVSGGGKLTIYGSDWGASDAEKFELAKLVVNRIPGIEKRILYLWGVTSGGERNHQKYRLAREWLDRLIAEINNSGNSV